ncbi:MAG TPA: endonuclease/exonuclease/phosphatase family protein [Bacteroidales bacterium]|nr:endonuclease/exonuclease/phosphatase family protein [Bacteroidales bacterium]
MKKHFSYFIIIFFCVFAGCSRDSEKNAIKIMTFNVRYDTPQDSVNAWPNRARQVYNFIKSEKPDILGMQEVLLSQFEALDSVLTEYTSTGVGRDDGAKGGEMNPVFFRKERFDLVRTITFWLSDTPDTPGSKGWGASLPRIVTWMELVDKNSHKHFFYFNTHFAHDSDSARIESSKILLKEVNKIASGFPFIITGDFNMPPTSMGYAILTGPDESVPLIKDSYVISEKRPSGPIHTFNGFSDKPGSRRIDYIFVKRGMKVLNYSTVVKKEKGVFISDHWPVKATILLMEN